MDLVTVPDNFRFQDDNIYKNAFLQFENIRSQGKFCDVTLKAEGRQFSAHKIVLASIIPYFHGMFMNDMIESDEKNIILHGLEANALEALINFAYRGEIYVTPSNVQSIFMGANFLQIISVRDACCDFMKKRMSLQTVFPLRSFSKSLFCYDLLQAADKFIYDNFFDVVKMSGYFDLSYEDVSDLISKDDLKIPNEEFIFEAIMKWIEYKPAERVECLPNLLRQIRLPQINPQYLLDNISNHPAIQNSLLCRNVIDATKDFLILPKQIKNLEPYNFRPRNLQNSLYGLIFVLGSSQVHQSCSISSSSNNNNSSTAHQLSMEVYHPIFRQWSSLKPTVPYRTRIGIAVLNHQVYLIGGFDGNRRLTTVEVFNTKKMAWTMAAPMNYNRSALGATVLGSKIYVCGGYDGTVALKSCEEYCPVTNRWRTITSMLECRSATGLVHLSGSLYAIGGHNGLAIDSTVERFDSVRQCWDLIKPMNSRRCRHGVLVVNQNIYVAGGYDGVNFLSSVEMYSAITDQWTNINPMKIPRSRISLVSTFGEIFAIGGFDGNSDLDTVESYNSANQKWVEICRLDNHMGAVACCVVSFSEVHQDILNLFNK